MILLLLFYLNSFSNSGFLLQQLKLFCFFPSLISYTSWKKIHITKKKKPSTCASKCQLHQISYFPEYHCGNDLSVHSWSWTHVRMWTCKQTDMLTSFSPSLFPDPNCLTEFNWRQKRCTRRRGGEGVYNCFCIHVTAQLMAQITCEAAAGSQTKSGSYQFQSLFITTVCMGGQV